MSIKAMTKVWDHSQQEGTRLLLMLALADYADDQGRSFPGIKTLAKKVRLDPRNVQRALRELEDAGEIKTITGVGFKGTNVYQITLTEGVALAPGVADAPGGGRRQRQGGDGASATRSVIEPSLNHSVTDVTGEAALSLAEQVRVALVALNTSKNKVSAVGDLHTLCFGYPPTDWPRLGAMVKRYGPIAVARTFTDMLASPSPDTLGAATLRLEGRNNAKKTTGKKADAGTEGGTSGVRGAGKSGAAGSGNRTGRNSSSAKTSGGPAALVPFEDE